MKVSRGKVETPFASMRRVFNSMDSRTIVIGSLLFAVLSLLLLNNLNKGDMTDKSMFAEYEPGPEISLRTNNNPYPEEETRFAYVPITAYNACNDRIKHLSCMKTVVTASVKTIVPLPQLTETVCNLIVGEEVQEVENMHVDVCLQVGTSETTVGAAVRMIEKEIFPCAEIVSFLRETEIEQMLPYFDTSGDFRIVDRSVAVTTSVYAPKSVANNKIRDKNDNKGNMIWNFGVRALMNPFTTVFVRREYKSPSEELDKFGVPPTVYVIGTANLFNLNSASKKNRNNGPDVYVNKIREKIEDFNLPTLMFGAGIQFDFTTMPMDRLFLHDSHKEILQALDDHRIGPYSVSVRGNVTEMACKNAGFSNCLPLGCPSLTINRSPNLGYDFSFEMENNP